MTELIIPRFGCTGEVCANSRGEKRAMHGTEEARKSIGGWKCKLSNTHISPKNSCTYYQ